MQSLFPFLPYSEGGFLVPVSCELWTGQCVLKEEEHSFFSSPSHAIEVLWTGAALKQPTLAPAVQGRSWGGGSEPSLIFVPEGVRLPQLELGLAAACCPWLSFLHGGGMDRCSP